MLPQLLAQGGGLKYRCAYQSRQQTGQRFSGAFPMLFKRRASNLQTTVPPS